MFKCLNQNRERVKGSLAFTLIELLIVIGILAILAMTVLLVINPAQLVKQSRDSNRITEMNQLNKALMLYQSFGGSSNMGTHGEVYISIPDTDPNSANLDLPTGPTYHCKTEANYRRVDGTGWIPVNFTSIQSSAGTLFSNLPIDPINTIENNLYYTYIPGSWALSATLESEKYLSTTAVNDGGVSDTRFEVGNNLAMNDNLPTESGGSWTCGVDTVMDIDNNIYNTVSVGTQCWMTENMMTTKYPDGSAITKGPTGATWDGTDLPLNIPAPLPAYGLKDR